MVARHARFALAPLLVVATSMACGGSTNDDAEVAALQASISRIEENLEVLNEQLAQIDARSAELQRQAEAAPAQVEPTPYVDTAPVTVVPPPDKPSRLAITLTAGTIEIAGEVVTLDQLRARFDKAAAETKPTVVIQASKDVEHATILEVMDAAKTAGITQLGVTKPAAI